MKISDSSGRTWASVWLTSRPCTGNECAPRSRRPRRRRPTSSRVSRRVRRLTNWSASSSCWMWWLTKDSRCRSVNSSRNTKRISPSRRSRGPSCFQTCSVQTKSDRGIVLKNGHNEQNRLCDFVMWPNNKSKLMTELQFIGVFEFLN